MEETQLVLMEITKGKASGIWCTIEHIKEHHEDHKHESYVSPQVCFWILLVIIGTIWNWICGSLKNFTKKNYGQEKKRKWHVLSHMRECK